MSSPWPFAQWGLDIVGPFPKVAGNKRYMLVGIDYFTKWVEAEPLANIRDADAKKFIWRNIVTRFGVPQTLISDNGLQFNSKAFRRYCCELGITNRYSTQLILREMDKSRLSTKSLSMGLRKEWMTPRENGKRSCHTSYELTGPHRDGQQETHLLP